MEKFKNCLIVLENGECGFIISDYIITEYSQIKIDMYENYIHKLDKAYDIKFIYKIKNGVRYTLKDLDLIDRQSLIRIYPEEKMNFLEAAKSNKKIKFYEHKNFRTLQQTLKDISILKNEEILKLLQEKVWIVEN